MAVCRVRFLALLKATLPELCHFYFNNMYTLHTPGSLMDWLLQYTSNSYLNPLVLCSCCVTLIGDQCICVYEKVINCLLLIVTLVRLEHN